MTKIVRIGNCVHVFDEEVGRYLKSTASRIRQALRAPAGQTRKEMLRQIKWAYCPQQACKVKACAEGGHWVPRD